MGNRYIAPENLQVQDRIFKGQKQKTIETFYQYPKTRKGFCPITKFRAGFYTTNTELIKTNDND